MSTASEPTRRARRVALSWWTVMAVLILAVLAWAGPDLPDPVANHFDASGRATDYSARTTFLAVAVGTGVALPGALLAWTLWSPGRFSVSRRAMAAGGLAVGAFVGIVMLAAVVLQRGLAEARTASLPPVLILLAVGVAVLVGALAWWSLPPGETGSDEPTADLRAIAVGPGEHVVWSGTCHAPLWLRALMVAMVLGVVVGFLLVPQPASLVGLAPLLLLPLVLWSLRVTVDPHGIIVRTGVGFPRHRFAFADLQRVEAVECRPVEYGGWGLRLAPGRRLGIILRGGPALRLVRRSGRVVVITVDDAATGAGLAAAYLGASGQPGGTRQPVGHG